MHGRRTALRYSPSTPSPAGARSRGQSTVLPFGSGWSAPSPSWRVPGGRCVRRAWAWEHASMQGRLISSFGVAKVEQYPRVVLYLLIKAATRRAT